jgi:hypothetical protein
MNISVTPTPFSAGARAVVFAIAGALCIMWAIGLYNYVSLPDQVPTHFGASGKPDAYGSKMSLLILPLAFSLAPVIILLVITFRFTLVNKYPFLVNLPAFYLNLTKIDPSRRGLWVNRYFALVAVLGLCLSLFFCFLLAGIYDGAGRGELAAWFLPVVLLFPVGIIIPFLYALYRMSKVMQSEIN